MGDKEFAGGWKTTIGGEHLPISADEAKVLWAACEAADAKRRGLMPDSMAALDLMQDALTRLKDEGWHDGIYCPKDGSTFAVIEFGSTGIFTGVYCGEWPDGHVIVCDGLSHPCGLLWKPITQLTDAEAAKLYACEEAENAARDREFHAFAAMDEVTP